MAIIFRRLCRDGLKSTIGDSSGHGDFDPSYLGSADDDGRDGRTLLFWIGAVEASVGLIVKVDTFGMNSVNFAWPETHKIG